VIRCANMLLITLTHVDGRSLYIVDWRMVVVEAGECSTPCKKGGELSRRGNVQRNMWEGHMFRGMSRSQFAKACIKAFGEYFYKGLKICVSWKMLCIYAFYRWLFWSCIVYACNFSAVTDKMHRKFTPQGEYTTGHLVARLINSTNGAKLNGLWLQTVVFGLLHLYSVQISW